MEGLYLAEYENICPIFSRDEWGPVYVATCQKSVGDFAKTLRELNGHVQRNLLTDCFLGYEIIDVVSNLSLRVERKTGELKRQLYDAAKPIRDTSKVSLSKLLDDTKARIQTLVSLPADGGPVSLTRDVMIRLQLMATYLAPLSSVLASVGDGGWASNAAAASSASLATFGRGRRRQQDLCPLRRDTMDTLLGGLGSALAAAAQEQERAGRLSRQQRGHCRPHGAHVGTSRASWAGTRASSRGGARRRRPCTSRRGASRRASCWTCSTRTAAGGRTRAGAGPGESAAIVKALSSKDRDAIKDKLKSFNTSFRGAGGAAPQLPDGRRGARAAGARGADDCRAAVRPVLGPVPRNRQGARQARQVRQGAAGGGAVEPGLRTAREQIDSRVDRRAAGRAARRMRYHVLGK